MKKIFLLAMAGLLTAGSAAYASGGPKDCSKCTKKECKQACKQKCAKTGKDCCAKKS